MTCRTALPVLTAAACMIAGVAVASDGESGWVAADEAKIRLVAAVSAVAPGAASVPVGLEMVLAEGWRIYWRTPGAAGLPPQFDWPGSENLAAVVLRWPVPVRFTLYGQQSYGYTGRVLFPLTALLERPGEAVTLRLALAYLICREVCIPGEAELSLSLSPGQARETAATAAIAAAIAALPAPAAEAGVEIEATATPGGLSVVARREAGFSDPDLFLEWPTAPGQRRPDLPRPRVTLAEGGREARFDVTTHPPLARPGTVLTVTLADATVVVEAAVMISPPR
jgi:suppressor for copper-sensitivity B